MTLRILMTSYCVAGFGLGSASGRRRESPFKRDLSKEFEDLTPSEQIAIRAAAKAAYKAKKLRHAQCLRRSRQHAVLQRQG